MSHQAKTFGGQSFCFPLKNWIFKTCSAYQLLCITEYGAFKQKRMFPKCCTNAVLGNIWIKI